MVMLPITVLNHLNLNILRALCIFVIGDRKDSKFDVQVKCASHFLGTWSGHVTHYKLWMLQSYHWNG